jgi:hypothetical protein
MKDDVRPSQRGFAWGALLFLAAAGCLDGGVDGRLVETETPVELAVPSSGAYGVLVAGPFRDGLQNVTLRIGSERLSLSSYQGVLRFDTERMRLLSVGHPEGDFHLTNSLDASSGVIRFAGFAVDGFATAVDLELSFENQQPVKSGDIRFDLEVLGTSGGGSIAAEDVFENHQPVPGGTH